MIRTLAGYRKLYRQVAGEVETVADIFTLQYIFSGRARGSDQDGERLPAAADRSEDEADTPNPVRAYG